MEFVFIKEERGQGALEYILLIGGIIMAAVVIFAIYGGMTKSTAESMNRTTDASSSAMSSRISAEVAAF